MKKMMNRVALMVANGQRDEGLKGTEGSRTPPALLSPSGRARGTDRQVESCSELCALVLDGKIAFDPRVAVPP